MLNAVLKLNYIFITGVVTIQEELDYERTPFTEFAVIAVDRGDPMLTSTAYIGVNVTNVNEGGPTFDIVSIPLQRLPRFTIDHPSVCIIHHNTIISEFRERIIL